MNIQELINILQTCDDKTQEVNIPDEFSNPHGVVPITCITDLLDGNNKKIGVVLL